MKICNRFTNTSSTKSIEEIFKAPIYSRKIFGSLNLIVGIIFVGTLAVCNTAKADDSYSYIALKVDTDSGEVDGPFSIKYNKDQEKIDYEKLRLHGDGGNETGHPRVRGYQNNVEISFSKSPKTRDPSPNSVCLSGTHIIFAGVHYCL